MESEGGAREGPGVADWHRRAGEREGVTQVVSQTPGAIGYVERNYQ